MSYFTAEEFLCKCGRPECDALTSMTPPLLSRLDLLRYRVGRALIVTSGLRCRFWNEHEGGERDSEHLTGDAVDLAVGSGRERYELIAANFTGNVRLFPRVGIGRDFIHVGLSSDHDRDVVWTYYATARPT